MKRLWPIGALLVGALLLTVLFPSVFLAPALRAWTAPRTRATPPPGLPHLAAVPGYQLTYQRYLERGYTEIFQSPAGETLEISAEAGPTCAALTPFLPAGTPSTNFVWNGSPGVVYRRENAKHETRAFTLLYADRGACTKLERRANTAASTPAELIELLHRMQ